MQLHLEKGLELTEFHKDFTTCNRRN